MRAMLIFLPLVLAGCITDPDQTKPIPASYLQGRPCAGQQGYSIVSFRDENRQFRTRYYCPNGDVEEPKDD